MTDQNELVAALLDEVVPIGEVPESFAQFVQERIAARPSPDAGVDHLARIESKLDEVLTLLKGDG